MNCSGPHKEIGREARKNGLDKVTSPHSVVFFSIFSQSFITDHECGLKIIRNVVTFPIGLKFLFYRRGRKSGERIASLQSIFFTKQQQQKSFDHLSVLLILSKLHTIAWSLSNGGITWQASSLVDTVPFSKQVTKRERLSLSLIGSLNWIMKKIRDMRRNRRFERWNL